MINRLIGRIIDDTINLCPSTLTIQQQRADIAKVYGKKKIISMNNY
jgi:hypothetical protein